MNVMQSFFDVMSGVTDFIVESFGSVTPLFYNAESGLTLIGVMSIAGLGIGVSFLLIHTVRDWFRLRH